MDQPQHQVFEANRQSYRYMAYPFQKQPLQLLYPGRVMQQDWHYTGENIPNEDPIGLEKTRFQTAALAKAAKMEQEALARHLGGRNKVVSHPAVEPEALIEDPDQASLSISTSFGLGGDLDNVPSKLGDLRQVEDRIRNITTNVRKELSKGNPDPLSKEKVLPTYDWLSSGVGYDGIKENIIETYASEIEGYTSGDSNITDDTTFVSCHNGLCTTTTCDNVAKTCTSQTCDKHKDNCDPVQTCDWSEDCNGKSKSSSSFGYGWIPIIIIAILAVVFVVLIMYGIHKHHAYAKAAQTNSFNILTPDYLPQGMTPDISYYP